jgi:hypothetical protein
MMNELKSPKEELKINIFRMMSGGQRVVAEEQP